MVDQAFTKTTVFNSVRCSCYHHHLHFTAVDPRSQSGEVTCQASHSYVLKLETQNYNLDFQIPSSMHGKTRTYNIK